MKQGIHPQLAQVKIECMCGNVVETLSTRAEGYKLEICDQCHPLYTGQQKIIDTAGRVERFRRKYAKPGS